MQIELRDQSNRVVTSEADLKQATNELYHRVNKRKSLACIRQGRPSAHTPLPRFSRTFCRRAYQVLSIYFYVVNEKFGTQNATLAESPIVSYKKSGMELLLPGKTVLRYQTDRLEAYPWRFFTSRSASNYAVKLTEFSMKMVCVLPIQRIKPQQQFQ